MYQLGANPQRSAQFFWRGFVAFWPCAFLIAYGAVNENIWFYLGITLLIPAFICAIYGYIGMLANRFAQVIGHADKAKQLFD
ncbi:hypothetical protein C2869_11335 [Saccharobesus litoralis]|uniref:Uncharacterized protein n=1 Tax=Saccharobesus litoralis TaxID=2172099 RepID=A0A2S0VXP3_9ALTE|nr:hypothetical protein C2869_11335 [Saccharobesus litoralis]